MAQNWSSIIYPVMQKLSFQSFPPMAGENCNSQPSISPKQTSRMACRLGSKKHLPKSAFHSRWHLAIVEHRIRQRLHGTFKDMKWTVLTVGITAWQQQLLFAFSWSKTSLHIPSRIQVAVGTCAERSLCFDSKNRLNITKKKQRSGTFEEIMFQLLLAT